MINGILNIYKEKGYTSHDVVARLRGIFGQKKIGHTGTLDPDAEGVLPVCLGRATKVCDLLTDKDKTYEAVLLLGKETDTQDITGTVLKECDPSEITEETAKKCIESFIGEYDQIPPMYSALKVNGKKLYELAREGKVVERKSRKVQILFDDKTFRYWNVETDSWEKEAGRYEICIGACALDIRLRETLEIEGTTDTMPYDAEKMPSYFSGIIRDVPDAEFEALLKQPIPDGKWSGELGMNDAICQMYYAKSRLARMIYKILTNLKKKSEDKGKPDLNILFIYNMPFRGIAKMTHGAVSMKMAEGMAEVVNGHFMKGMKKVLGGFFENRKANKEYEKKLGTGK